MPASPALPRLLRRGALVAVASLALSAAIATPAHAASVVFDPDTNNSAYKWHLNPANEVNGGNYTITLDPTGRSGAPGGNSALTWGPGTIRVDTGCPVDYRASSRSFVVTEDGVESEIVTPRSGENSVGWGLDGAPIKLSSARDVGDWTYLNAAKLPTGTNALVITCDPTGDPDSLFPIPSEFYISNSKYFVAYINVDRAGQSWALTSKPSGPAKTDTTTTVASSAVTSTSATVTATVPNDATGTVQFTQDGTPVGNPVTVSNGTAQTQLTGLTAGTSYTIGAQYSGDSKYNGSTGSTTVKTADPVATAPVSVGVTVPTATTAAPTGLKLTAPSSAIALTGPQTRTTGQVWVASGSLGTVTVNDDRQNTSAGAWTLNGRVSDLTSGSSTISASHLGWSAPTVTGVGTAGAAVTPDNAGGLTSDKALATGAASASPNQTTTVATTITLNTPADAPAGNYTGTLTLTVV